MTKTRKESVIVSMIKKLDRNGAQIGFLFNGNSQNQSLIGAFISILSLFGSLYLSIGTFINFVDMTDPKITIGSEFSDSETNSNTTFIDFNETSLYMRFSFYANRYEKPTYQFNDNNFSLTNYYNKLDVLCTNCSLGNKSIDTNTINMFSCNKDEFDEIKLKSMSSTKSKRIMNIFKNFSFCIPDQFNGAIKDGELENIDINNKSNSNSSDSSDIKTTTYNQDSSFTIVIYENQFSYSESGVQSNNISRAGEINTNVLPPPNYKPPPPQQQPPPPQQQPPYTQQQPPNTQQQPSPQQQQPPPPQQQPTTQPTTQLTPQPTTQPTTKPNSQPTKQPIPKRNLQPEQTTINIIVTKTQRTQPISQTNNKLMPSRIQKNKKPKNSKGSPRLLQQNIPGIDPKLLYDLQNHIERVVMDKIQKIIEDGVIKKISKITEDGIAQKIKTLSLPKILLLSRNFKINPNARILNNEALFENVFELDILDYRDVTTGNPKSYDVYIQKTTIVITKPQYIFSSKIEVHEILKISKIEANPINSNVNQGALFSFKPVPEIQKIEITFVTIYDWLSIFGGFSTVFGLINVIISGFYSEILLNNNIINSLFSFIDNNEDKFKKDIFGFNGNLQDFYKEKLIDKMKIKYKNIKNYEKVKTKEGLKDIDFNLFEKNKNDTDNKRIPNANNMINDFEKKIKNINCSELALIYDCNFTNPEENHLNQKKDIIKSNNDDKLLNEQKENISNQKNINCEIEMFNYQFNSKNNINSHYDNLNNNIYFHTQEDGIIHNFNINKNSSLNPKKLDNLNYNIVNSSDPFTTTNRYPDNLFPIQKKNYRNINLENICIINKKNITNPISNDKIEDVEKNEREKFQLNEKKPDLNVKINFIF